MMTPEIPGPEEEVVLLKFLSRVELTNLIASFLLIACMLGACFLLDRNHRQLTLLQGQLHLRNEQGRAALVELQMRNEQGSRELVLLQEAVERLHAPVSVDQVPAPQPVPVPVPLQRP
jgi:hypothetical protein